MGNFLCPTIPESADLSKMAKNVIIVATSADKLGDHATGAWSEEITGPFYVFKEAGFNVEIASVAGGKVTIDAGSLSDNFKTENDKRFEAEGATSLLAATKALKEVDLDSVDAIFLAGGHGTCVDFADGLADAVTAAYAKGKVVGAVCHGPTGLVKAKDGDAPLVKGKKVAAFTDVEEEQVGLTAKVPFLLEKKLKELGADFVIGAPWSETAVRDGRLVTGQNPQSSVKAAKLVVEALAAKTVIIVATSADKLGDHATGAWSEEITGPYFTFKDAGLNVQIASVSGGKVTIDAGSLSDSFKTENDKRFEAEKADVLLASTKAIKDVNLDKVDAIFLAGGHGTCVDFPTGLADVVTAAYAKGKVVGAVCHGPTGLVNAKDGDEPLVKGKKIAAFTDVEEEQVGLTGKVPFLLEKKLKELGGDFVIGAPWSETAVRDGRLVTGQNPQSSVKAAKLVLEALA